MERQTTNLPLIGTIEGVGTIGGSMFVSVSFPWAARALGLPLTYGFYAVCAVLSLPFVVRAVRETRGIKLEDMAG